MKKKGFLKAEMKKAIVSLDHKLGDKIEQYVNDVSDKQAQGKEPLPLFNRMKFLGVDLLKESLEKVRNRFDF